MHCWVSEAREHAHQEAQRYLNARQEELRRQGFETRVLLRDTSAAEEIIDVATAEGVDLIVMSTHGRGGLARWTSVGFVVLQGPVSSPGQQQGRSGHEHDASDSE